jgi:hypothetical protein
MSQTEVVMKTRENVDSKNVAQGPLKVKAKAKSLRPMRSMVAVRSLKPKTSVATMVLKSEEAAAE